ncbi:MAG: SPASM domain-containing protein, partial [Firmicutes bacterium]|nr:SPASM domain-containing protein [Bacillota bacterium]
SDFRNAHVYNKTGCGTCWARFICSGGCHAAAYGSSASILAPDKVACAIQKKRIECALTAQAMLKDVQQQGA